MKYKHSSFDIHVSADMTACPWKLNHGDHHVSCFYHCHTHTRFPRRRSNPRHDVPRRGHGSSDVAITALPYLSFTGRWDPRLWVPHVSDRMVGLFASGDPHPPLRAPHPSRPHRSYAFVCMTCRPAELRRPSTFYHSHTQLDAVCLLRSDPYSCTIESSVGVLMYYM